MYVREFEIPEGVNVEIDKNKVKVSGQKGEIDRLFKGIFDIKIEKSKGGKKITVSSESTERKKKAIVGSIIAHIKNMARGVTEGYTAKLKVLYSHFPVTVKVEGNKILINNFLGEKIPRESKIFGDDTKVEVKGPDITVTGIDIEKVGQTAASMEIVTTIKKFDRKVFQDGIYITKKPKAE